MLIFLLLCYYHYRINRENVLLIHHISYVHDKTRDALYPFSSFTSLCIYSIIQTKASNRRKLSRIPMICIITHFHFVNITKICLVYLHIYLKSILTIFCASTSLQVRSKGLYFWIKNLLKVTFKVRLPCHVWAQNACWTSRPVLEVDFLFASLGVFNKLPGNVYYPKAIRCTVNLHSYNMSYVYMHKTIWHTTCFSLVNVS